MDFKSSWILFSLLSIFFLLAQFNIFVVDSEPWFDVSFSLETAHKLNTEGFNSIDFRFYDVHPPIYYYFLAVWQKFNLAGISEYHWARELSVLFMMGFFIFAYFSLDKLFGNAGKFAVWVLSIASTYIHYGTEVRMYSLVLLFSAMILWGLVNKLEKWYHKWCVAFSLVLLPLVHYMAVMAFPFFALFYYVYRDDLPKKERLVKLLVIVGIGFIGFLASLSYLIPQRARIEGTWLQPPGVSSFVSALFYSFFTVDNSWSDFTFASLPIYVVFVGAIILLAIVGFRKISKEDLQKAEKLLLFMGLTGLAPLFVLVFLVFYKFNLYHHRFFLVLTWMFAASSLIILCKWLVARQKWLRILFSIATMFIFSFMSFQYFVTSHYDLKIMMQATPCPKNETLWIGHESPFSSLPYTTWARIYGCNWVNFVSTNVSLRMANAGGYNIMDPSLIYWNLTLPNNSFYYVMSDAQSFQLHDRIAYPKEAGDGIWLAYVEGKNQSGNIYI